MSECAHHAVVLPFSRPKEKEIPTPTSQTPIERSRGPNTRRRGSGACASSAQSLFPTQKLPLNPKVFGPDLTKRQGRELQEEERARWGGVGSCFSSCRKKGGRRGARTAYGGFGDSLWEPHSPKRDNSREHLVTHVRSEDALVREGKGRNCAQQVSVARAALLVVAPIEAAGCRPIAASRRVKANRSRRVGHRRWSKGVEARARASKSTERHQRWCCRDRTKAKDNRRKITYRDHAKQRRSVGEPGR